MNRRIYLAMPVFMGLLVLLTAVAFAHVTLNPREAVPGYQSYIVRVPTEKTVPTTTLRLVVPDGADVTGILPVNGWKYSTVKEHMEEHESEESEADHSHEEEEERITEIIWTGGNILPGEFFEFPISVRYQGDPTTLVWKAYQTYSDGEVVAWDDTVEGQPAPKVAILKEAKIDAVTNAVNDLKTQQQASGSQISQLKTEAQSTIQNSERTLWISIAALLLGFAALVVSLKKKSK